ncbi:hypothetical protein D3C85_1835160 [compost metagenome]
MMTSMVGPQVFEDVIIRSDKSFSSVFTQYKAVEVGGRLGAELEGEVAARMPLSRFITSGTLNSWA